MREGYEKGGEREREKEREKERDRHTVKDLNPYTLSIKLRQKWFRS